VYRFRHGEQGSAARACAQFELIAQMDVKLALAWLSRVAASLGLVGNATVTSCTKLHGHVDGSALNMSRFKDALAVGEHQMRPLRLEFSERKQPNLNSSLAKMGVFEGFMAVSDCPMFKLE